jgi:ElaA protein
MASLLRWQCHTFESFTPHTLYEMLRLRDQVFVLEQQSIYGDLDNLDQIALHLCGYDTGGCLRAYARLLGPGDKYDEACAITRVVVDPAWRGQGIGRQVVAQSLDACADRFPAVAQKLSAQLSALALYASFGFKQISEPYDDGGILHVDMLRHVEV